MPEVMLNIGGLAVRYSGGPSLAYAMNIPGMYEFLAQAAKADIDVRLDRRLTLPECRWLHSFEIADGSATCRFGVDAEGIYYYLFGERSLLRYDEREPAVVEISGMDNVAHLRFALWVAYSMAALRRGRVPVHSSTVVCQRRGVMCLGESGTGKSTHTRLWLNNIADTHLLNDDSPIVALVDGVATVFGSPWSGKTHCYRPEHFPIAALLRLEQRPENTIRRLGTVEAFTALQPSCPPSFAKDDRSLDLLCDFISGIIGRVPAFRLGCLPDADAANLSFSTIFSAR